VRWWNELLGQGIKLRKKLFQFSHTVIAHIAPGIQGCSFVICPALPQNALAIRFRHLRLPWLLLWILSLLLILGLFGSFSNEKALSFPVISSKLESFKS
jgi:hypothetical protein